MDYLEIALTEAGSYLKECEIRKNKLSYDKRIKKDWNSLRNTIKQ